MAHCREASRKKKPLSKNLLAELFEKQTELPFKSAAGYAFLILMR